VEIQREPVLK